MTTDESHFTLLLQRAEEGDAQAANQLFVHVQDELKKITRNRKKRLALGVDMPTTAIVDEAYCRAV